MKEEVGRKVKKTIEETEERKKMHEKRK